MKTIKIFLASSIKEFAEERISLKNFVRKMENVLIDHAVFLKMFICEYADNAIADGRKQDEFSREIDDSDIFFILVGQHIGEYTLEEYEYALNIQRQRGDGTILACFKVCDEVRQSVMDYSEKLDANAVRVDFDNVTELKAAFARVIGKMLCDTVPIHIENEKVLIAGKAVKL